jgi:D-alanyl-D-alanine carboxypeptidase
MTAILALESGKLDRSFVVSSAAADTAPSSIGLLAGQRMELRHLLYALMLNSANDAAEVIAEGLAGSRAAFAEQMTSRAHEIGAITAQFMNPHGLTMPGHVASAYDLAVIMRHGLRTAGFRQLLETPSARVPVQSRGVRYVSLRSHNRLLSGQSYSVIGKTGFTRAAGRCYVGATEHNGREVIIAVLGSRDLWGDARRLAAYGVGEAPEEPRLQTASVSRSRTRTRTGRTVRTARAARQTAEGDDDAEAGTAKYAVRLGPYRTKNAALAVRQKLGRRGFSARLAGRSLHVGTFTSITRAERIAGQLRRTGYDPTVILL